MRTLKNLLILPLMALPIVSVMADDFTDRRDAMRDKSVFSIFDSSSLKGDTLEAMRFLYSYMPLPDLTAYPDTMHLRNVETSLRARREMPWGEKVPEREWRHFVLPARVNNEALDLSRPVFYEELRDRVKNLSMKDAILEVNHWCHEKVTYRPSDGRTSSPLSAVSQAIGRCGEESTFTVAALRAVGIPARQVYTPRWAHTDDNHAWVEAWADGDWYFLGACEPAPLLDMAWFNAPASRGMLMTTSVFGKYNGPEEQIEAGELLTTINVTSKYAPVDTLRVAVRYLDGRPVRDAKVRFSLYNYAEFYPVATKQTDAEGRASLTAGLGDMIVWATDGERFGWGKGRPGTDALEITLDHDAYSTASFDITITPPRGSGILPSPTAAEVAANDRRLQTEDSIRTAYTATFPTPEETAQVAASLGMDAKRLCAVIGEARGNGRRLLQYLGTLPSDSRETALTLLEAVTEKDRRDIPLEVIMDHILNTTADSSADGYAEYILSPRILTEQLTPFRSYLQKAAGDELLSKFRNNPSTLTEWVCTNISTDRAENPKGLPMPPIAVWNERRCDPRSRDIFYVAMARTAGLPSRIDPVTGKVQLLEVATWTDVSLSPKVSGEKKETAQRDIRLAYEQVGRLDNPKYYYQFSLSRIDGGEPRQLEYDEGDGFQELNNKGLSLDNGQYLLLTGQRMADGSVLAHGELFSTTADLAEIPLTIRQDPTGVQVIGSLNAENIYHDLATDTDCSLLSTTGRGYYVLGLIRPGDEPSAHALNDISSLRGELEKWGGIIMLLFADADAAGRFDASAFRNLPSTVTFGIDNGGVSLNELQNTLNLTDASMPIFIVADTFNRVVFVSQGYTIGLGDRIADVIGKLQ